MNRFTFPRVLTLKEALPVHKIALDDDDLQAVADLVCDEIYQGFYQHIIPERRRSEVLVFLRRLAVRCELEEYDNGRKRIRSRVAALVVYAVGGVVVGYGVLAQTAAKSKEKDVELLMIGVDPVYRGIGYGAAILDNLIRSVSPRGFFLTVKCPSGSQLLFAMLVTRGFLAMKRYCRGRVLRLAPFSPVMRPMVNPQFCRYVE